MQPLAQSKPANKANAADSQTRTDLCLCESGKSPTFLKSRMMEAKRHGFYNVDDQMNYALKQEPGAQGSGVRRVDMGHKKEAEFANDNQLFFNKFLYGR